MALAAGRRLRAVRAVHRLRAAVALTRARRRPRPARPVHGAVRADRGRGEGAEHARAAAPQGRRRSAPGDAGVQERQGARRPERGRLHAPAERDDRLGISRPGLRLLSRGRRLRVRRQPAQGGRTHDAGHDAPHQHRLEEPRRRRGSHLLQLPPGPADPGRDLVPEPAAPPSRRDRTRRRLERGGPHRARLLPQRGLRGIPLAGHARARPAADRAADGDCADVRGDQAPLRGDDADVGGDGRQLRLLPPVPQLRRLEPEHADALDRLLRHRDDARPEPPVPPDARARDPADALAVGQSAGR